METLPRYCSCRVCVVCVVCGVCVVCVWHTTHAADDTHAGKKRNVLRQRIDSYSYDVDQLLLGTLLFTVIFFLLPTTFVFYLYFGVLRLLVLCLYAALAFLTEGLNHFPLYALVLSLYDPKSLPSAPPPSLSFAFDFVSFALSLTHENLQAAFRFRRWLCRRTLPGVPLISSFTYVPHLCACASCVSCGN